MGELGEASQGRGFNGVIVEDTNEAESRDMYQTSDMRMVNLENDEGHSSLSKMSKEKTSGSYKQASRLTIFSEFETIEIAIQIIDLLSILHNKNIVHTNLNPNNIFLVDGQINKMCFLNLYHCSWQTQELMNNSNIGMEFEDNISLFDTRTRNKMYISPE